MHNFSMSPCLLIPVSALEAAADKYRLIHTEKICLLALGYAHLSPFTL